MMENLSAILYLVAAVLFITGLKQLQSPETARQGNRVSGVGMLLGVVSAAGLVMLAWGASQAMQAARAPA